MSADDLREHRPIGDPGEPDEGPYCEADGEHWPCEVLRELRERTLDVLTKETSDGR